MDKGAKERIATQLTASEASISVPQAMKAAGFPTPDRNNSTLTKRAWHKSKDLVVVDQKSRSGDSALKTVSNDAQPSRIEELLSVMANQCHHSQSHHLAHPEQQQNSAPNDDTTAVKRALVPPPHKVGKCRQTSKQKHQDDADKRRRLNNEKAAIKMITNEIDHHNKRGNKISQRQIVTRVNNHMGTNVSATTVSQMVREGRIGISP